MTIGQRIKARRNELKLSQRELAARLGYNDHTTLTRIEAGKVDLTQSKVVQFADVLGVTPAYLMGWEKEPEELADITAQILTDPHALSMFEDYLSLSESDRYAARLMISSLASKQKKTDAGGVSQEVEKVSLSETE